MPETEQELLKRLRDQQVAARDPGVKTRKLQKDTAVKAHKYKKKMNLKDMWSTIPHIWRSMIYGALLGLLLIGVLPRVWASSYATVISIVGAIVIVAVSALIGQAIDKRDEIRDLIK